MEPLETSHRLCYGVVGERAIFVESDWLETLVLHVDFNVVLKVLAYFWVVYQSGDAKGLQVLAISNA
jgi:hypothetical protein